MDLHDNDTGLIFQGSILEGDHHVHSKGHSGPAVVPLAGSVAISHIAEFREGLWETLQAVKTFQSFIPSGEMVLFLARSVVGILYPAQEIEKVVN